MAVPRPRPATDPTSTTGTRTRAKTKDPNEDPVQNRGTRGTRGSGSDAPPRDRSRAAAAAAPRQPSPRAGSLEARLNDWLAAATLPFAVAGDDYSAQIIALRSPALAKSLADLARENKAVNRILNRIMEGSAWGGVAIASLSIIIPICQHHNLIPGNDPFAAMMPAPQAPRKMAWGSGGPTPAPGSTMGAPGPGSGGDRPPADRVVDPEADYKPRVPGSPPGVVTVAQTTADHAN